MAVTLVVFLAGLLLPVSATPASAADWHFETLDGAGGPNGRINSSVGEASSATLYGGLPHVWYYDRGNGDLRHAWWTGWTWHFETLDGAGGPNGRINSDVGGFAVVALYSGHPHVWYPDTVAWNLRHAWWTGTTWHFETLDGHQDGPNGRINSDLGGSPAVTLYGGHPHVWYTDFVDVYSYEGNLRHAWWTGTTWHFETLDGAGGPNGRINSNVGGSNAAALDAGGYPHVWYRDWGNGDLRHARWTGLTWVFETIDGAGGPNGRVDGDVGSDSAVVLYCCLPHVFYDHNSWGNENLRHAWWTGWIWHFETLDGAGGPNGRVDGRVGRGSAATIYLGQPHVWYNQYTREGDPDSGYGALRHAWYG